MPTFLKRLSTSSWILVSLILGIGCGLFFGEAMSDLEVVGDAFIGLLQMTVLPYIIVSLIANIGRLSAGEGKRFTLYIGSFMIASTILVLAVVVLAPLSLPHRETASFFSTGMLEPPPRVDFL